MDIAFHFDAKPETLGGFYGRPLQKDFFRGLLRAAKLGVHVRIRTGDFRVLSVETQPEAALVLSKALSLRAGRWGRLDEEMLANALTRGRVYVILAVGMMRLQARIVDRYLREKQPLYAGFMEMSATNDVDWKHYYSTLPELYRVWNSQLRLIRPPVSDDGDGFLKEWADVPFSKVLFEYSGWRGTIADDWATQAHAVRTERVGGILDHLASSSVNDALLRVGDHDPRLVEAMDAILQAFLKANTADELAQAAFSCRRFIERLADMVQPPTEPGLDGRKLDKPSYRNRIWRYVEDRLSGQGAEGALVLQQFDDMGKRLDRLDSLANKGLHAEIDRESLRRLIVSLVLFTSDLLSLAPPPVKGNSTPYEPRLSEIFGDVGNLDELDELDSWEE